MDRSANCRSQIASLRVAPLHGTGNRKRCVRRRRHRRNPAPLASGNEILFVAGGRSRLDCDCPGRQPAIGQGRRRWARAQPVDSA